MKTELDLKPTPYDGKRAIITGDHPRKDCVATCLGAELTGLGWALRFEDNEETFYVFNPKNVKWL